VITINIDPIIFSVGHLMVRWYGLIVMAAIASGVWVAMHEARRKGLAEDDLGDAILWVIVAGILGARLFHVIDHWPDEFASNPLRALYIWEVCELERVMGEQEGIIWATVNFAAGEANIVYDPGSFDLASLAKVVNEQGYAVVLGDGALRWWAVQIQSDLEVYSGKPRTSYESPHVDYSGNNLGQDAGAGR
jgi:copper chaperone CopZ